ncbi:MAG: hypothetical protein ACJ77N_10795 [Chloroflexota bacterium]
MRTAVVPGFLPSVNGFRFTNAWPPGPTIKVGPLDPRWIGIGDARDGLCGGMVVAAKDLFEARSGPVDVPPDTEPFANGSPRFRAIVRRQIQSLDYLRVPLRYWALQARPDHPTLVSRLLRRETPLVVAVRELARIRDEIDGGRTAVVGLVRASGRSPSLLSLNHQVLAFGYEETPGRIAIRVYDPNHPGRDDVELVATLAPDGRPLGLAQSTGEPLRTLFLQPYPRPGSLAAWRGAPGAP